MKNTLTSGTNTATWEAGVLESSNAATPGTLIRDVIPLEKSFGSKNWTSFVAKRQAEDSSGEKRIDGLYSNNRNTPYHKKAEAV